MSLRVVGLGGSLVAQSTSLSALREAVVGASDAGATVEVFDVRALDLPMYSPELTAPPQALQLASAVRSAQAMIWSSPLYHGTVSGSFKNALDWLELLGAERPSYLTNKVIGLVGVAGGSHGLQAVNTMEFIVRSLRGWSLPLVIPISNASRVFDGDGVLRDRDVARQLRALGREVVEAAGRLSEERE